MSNVDIHHIVIARRNSHPLFDTPYAETLRLELSVLVFKKAIDNLFQTTSDVSRETFLAALGEIHISFLTLCEHLDMTEREIDEYMVTQILGKKS